MCYTGECPYEKINGYNGGECMLDKCMFNRNNMNVEYEEEINEPLTCDFAE